MINLEQTVSDAKNHIKVCQEEYNLIKEEYSKKYPVQGPFGVYYNENENEYEEVEREQKRIDIDQASLNVRWAKLHYYTALAQLDNSKLRLTKEIDDMTDAELQAFDAETAARQASLKAALPADLVPMPGFEEQLADLKKTKKEEIKESDITDNIFAKKGGLATDLYQVASIESIFDANPAMAKAMSDMRKVQSKSMLLVEGNKLVGMTAYLSVTFDDEMADQAIAAITADLQLLADNDLIEGSISLPKVMTLLNAKAIYVFPIVNLDKLESVTGINRVDIGIKFDEALKKIGLKTSAREGEIGANFKISKVS